LKSNSFFLETMDAGGGISICPCFL